MSDAADQARELLADPPIGVEVWGPIVEGLLGELEGLHTWDGLMSLVDEHYPTDIFPHLAGQPDDPDRDPGPRILSLIREVDRLRAIDADLAKARNVIEQVREQVVGRHHGRVYHYGSETAFLAALDRILADTEGEELA